MVLKVKLLNKINVVTYYEEYEYPNYDEFIEHRSRMSAAGYDIQYQRRSSECKEAHFARYKSNLDRSVIDAFKV